MLLFSHSCHGLEVTLLLTRTDALLQPVICEACSYCSTLVSGISRTCYLPFPHIFDTQHTIIMDFINRHYKRAKEKINNKRVPRMTQLTVASRESFTGGSANSGASSPSHPRPSIDPTAAERSAIGAGISNSSNTPQRPDLEIPVERGGQDGGISRPQSLPEIMISKQTYFACDNVHYQPGVLDEAPEVVPEVPYCLNANEEATSLSMAPSDSCAQPSDPDVVHTSNRIGKLEVSAKRSMI
jgi:hypothetical protein